MKTTETKITWKPVTSSHPDKAQIVAALRQAAGLDAGTGRVTMVQVTKCGGLVTGHVMAPGVKTYRNRRAESVSLGHPICQNPAGPIAAAWTFEAAIALKAAKVEAQLEASVSYMTRQIEACGVLAGLIDADDSLAVLAPEVFARYCIAEGVTFSDKAAAASWVASLRRVVAEAEIVRCLVCQEKGPIGGFACKCIREKTTPAAEVPQAVEAAAQDPIAVGAIVRSFDFEGRDLTGPRACYVLGLVEGIDADGYDCPRYKIRTIARIFSGEAVAFEAGELVFPPVNGTGTTFGRVTEGVEAVIPA